MPRSLTRISLALVLLLSGEVWALGLGELRLDSALNEPLRAEIELVAASPEEVQNLQVGLASAETFERYGLERPYYLQNLIFEVVRSGRADGNVVRVRSATPMTEPFLTFLIEATWSNGRLLREYTVLLDPPTFAPRDERAAQPEVTAPRPAAPADSGRIERTEPEPAAPAATAPARQPAAPREVAEPAVTQPAVDEPAVAEEADEARTAEPGEEAPAAETAFNAAAGEAVSVVRGDTLWGIASRVRPDSRLSMNQTMLAIYEANPEAFGGNINILRAGTRLRIPSADEIYRIDRLDAYNEAVRQNEAWQGRPAPAPAVAAVPEPETRPSLTLVPPDEEPAGAGTEVTGEVTDEPVEAEPASREQEILDRIAELEAADVPVQESLIQIRDNELANLRRQLAEIRGEELPAEAEGPFVEEETPAEETAAEPPEGELVPEFDEAATGDDTVAGDTEEAGPAPATRIQRSEEPSLVDTVLDWLTNVWVLLGVALVLVIAILVWFMRRGGGDEPDAWHARLDAGDAPEVMAATESLRAPSRHDESFVVVEQSGRLRKRDRQRDIERDIEREIETVETRQPVVADDATGGFGSLEDTFSSETAVNLDQSDPIAEADFHMAYGLYDQAADLVNGALQAEPERQDLLTKLCEIYFVWGNREAFVESAQRLHAVTGGRSDDWDKIVIMGQQIAPDDELFAGVAGGTKAVDLAFDDEEAGGTGALDMDFGAGDGGGDELIDLGGDAAAEGIDFVFDDDATTGKTVEMRAVERTVETPTLEEQFSALGSTGTHRKPAAGAARPRTPRSTDATAEIDLDDLGLDLDGMDETELAALDDDDATELASLDDLDATGKNESLDDTVDARADTGRNEEVNIDDTGLLGSLDLDDDDFTSTRTGMRLAADETGVNPAQTLAEETAIDDDLLAATGRTQVLPDDYAVETFGDAKGALGDEDKTMLATSLRDADFDFAKTEALPPGTYPGDDDVTGEMPALASTDMDLDLDDLTEALKRTDKGDTVEQPRDDRTVEHRRPDFDDETDETLSFSPDDLSEELDEARTMTEVGTKLDLARAYVDMGDPAGARSILEEVLDEGDSGQRQQAQKLLDSLPS